MRSLLTIVGLLLAVPVTTLNLAGVVVLMVVAVALAFAGMVIMGASVLFACAADWLRQRSKAISRWVNSKAGAKSS